MASKLPHDVSPFLQRLREFLLGRQHISPLRFPERVSARTQPPPSLPTGCNDKLANNYYYTRDGRRLVMPDETLFENITTKMIRGAKSESSAVAVTPKARTPGPVYLPPLKDQLN